MTKAIESGMAKFRIEESATRKQARIDAGAEIIVGVNKYCRSEEDKVSVLNVDGQMALEGQVRPMPFGVVTDSILTACTDQDHAADRNQEQARRGIRHCRLGEITPICEAVSCARTGRSRAPGNEPSGSFRGGRSASVHPWRNFG